MILTNRRIRLLFLCLAGMDVAVLLVWLRVLFGLWARNGNPAGETITQLLDGAPLWVFLGTWGLLLFYMVCADLLDRAGMGTGGRALTLFGLVAISSLISVRGLLYPDAAFGDFGWLREVVVSLVNIGAGVRGEVLLILANYLLWQRVASYTDRSLTFFAVGLSFRLGLLLMTLGAALAGEWLGQPFAAGVTYLLLFFAFGLAVVALARIDQKALGASNSSGALLPWDRFAALWVSIVAMLGAAMTLAAVYTPTTLRTVVGWFGPVGVVLGWLLTQIVFLIFLVLTPLLEALLARIQSIMAENPLPVGEVAPPPPPLNLGEVVEQVAVLRYCLSALILVTALVILYLLFVRIAQRTRRAEKEEVEGTEEGVRPGGVDLGLGRLADWLARLGRYGVGNQLLAAITVENIYANLTRLARRKGFGRAPAEDPTRYLARLNQAFPEHGPELATITAAYLRVRYAERPISPEELDEVRAAYAAVIAPPAPEGDAPAQP
jgi:hypothetical protein